MTNQEITPTERKFIAQHIQTRSIYNEADNYCVRVEWKNEKTKEPKKFVLVLGNNRIYFFKPAGKIQFDTHLFQIVELRSENPKELTVKMRDDSHYTIMVQHEKEITEIADAVTYLWHTNFPGAQRGIKVYPASLITESVIDVGPCGGFNLTYLAICDYLGQVPAPEIIWQCESYYGPKGITIFDFDVFGKKEMVIASDMKAIMLVLMNNNYFTELHIKKVKIPHDGIVALANAVSCNSVLTKLVLAQSGLTNHGCEKIIDGLNNTSSIPLAHLDLSGNQIEDKGFIAVADYLKKRFLGLSSLNLSDCGASRKGCVAVLEALTQTDVYSKTLTKLSLSGNQLDTDGTIHLGNFMQKTSNLYKLDVANAGINFLEFRACQPVEALDISGNKITKKNVNDLAKVLTMCTNLKNLKMAKVSLPTDNLTDLFKTVLPKLRKLDISDTELSDEHLLSILEMLMGYTALTTLNISGNFSKSKQKHRHALVEALCGLVTRKHPPIEHLVMHSPKHPLKHDILPFLLSLIDPKVRLKSLDISNQEIGDVGACSLGKVLQTNRGLTSISWDGSATSVTGLDFFLVGLHRNSRLTEHYIPVCDVASIIKKTGEASAYTPQVQPLVEEMQDRVGVITRESFSLNKLSLSPQAVREAASSPSPSPKVASRSLKPRKREISFNLDIKSALIMFPEVKAFNFSENMANGE